MTLEMWTAFALVAFVAILTPGPAVLLVISNGMYSGIRMTVWNILGILLINVVYLALSMTGLSLIILTSSVAFHTLKWLGVAYLCYIGFKMIQESGQPFSQITPQERSSQKRKFFFQALFLQAGNPKAMIFYLALVPQFISIEKSILPQYVIMVTTELVIEFLVLFCYGSLAQKLGQKFLNERFARIQQKVSGGFFLAAALGLARTRQQ